MQLFIIISFLNKNIFELLLTWHGRPITCLSYFMSFVSEREMRLTRRLQSSGKDWNYLKSHTKHKPRRKMIYPKRCCSYDYLNNIIMECSNYIPLTEFGCCWTDIYYSPLYLNYEACLSISGVFQSITLVVWSHK